MSKSYGVDYDQVQISILPFLHVLLFGDNLMESVDIWKNQGIFSVDVTYNYGSGISVPDKPMQLAPGNAVYFE